MSDGAPAAAAASGWFNFGGMLEGVLSWLRNLFFKQEMELTLVGLQNSGKTTLVNVVATGGFSEDMIPTVGFNMRKVTKGKVTIKLWDLGGQPRFRSMWERYCRGVNAMVYVVDSVESLIHWLDFANQNAGKSRPRNEMSEDESVRGW